MSPGEIEIYFDVRVEPVKSYRLSVTVYSAIPPAGDPIVEEHADVTIVETFPTFPSFRVIAPSGELVYLLWEDDVQETKTAILEIELEGSGFMAFVII